MRLIVTGPENALPTAREKVRAALIRWEANNGVREFGSGCARGVDSIFALEALSLFPEAEHHLFVPAARSNAVELTSYGDVWVEHFCPAAATDGEAYGKRNTAMCEWAHEDGGVLLAFPNDGREVRRGSGTWWTVRIAQRLRLAVIIEPLDGSPVVRLDTNTTPPRADWLS